MMKTNNPYDQKFELYLIKKRLQLKHNKSKRKLKRIKNI